MDQIESSDPLSDPKSDKALNILSPNISSSD